MHDFKDYIISDGLTVSDANLDVFRSDPPFHVRNLTCCIEEMHLEPDRWKLILRKYGVTLTRFKNITKLAQISGPIIRTRINCSHL